MGKVLQTAEGAPEVRHYANEIVQSRSYEVAQMLTWLDGWGRGRGEEDRGAMVWMGHSFSVAERVRELAGRIAKYQAVEIRELEATRSRLAVASGWPPERPLDRSNRSPSLRSGR